MDKKNKILLASYNSEIIRIFSELNLDLQIVPSFEETLTVIDKAEVKLAFIDQAVYKTETTYNFSNSIARATPVILIATEVNQSLFNYIHPTEIIDLSELNPERIKKEINLYALQAKYYNKQVRSTFIETIMFEISEIFLSADPDNLDEPFSIALNKILDFTSSDFASIYKYSEDNKTLSRVSFVGNNNCKRFDRLDLEELPWLNQRFNVDMPCLVPNIAGMSPESFRAKGVFASMDINSFTLVPIFDNEYAIACLLVGSRDAMNVWPEESSALIIRAAKLFGSTFVRRRRRKTALARIDILEGILRATEARFTNIMESLAEGLIMADQNGVLTYANTKFCEITGYSKEEIVGNRIYQLFFANSPNDHTKDIERMHQRYNERMSGMSETYEMEIARKDGTLRWLEISAAPLRDSSGLIVGSIGMNTDITDKKQLEHQLRWSQKMEAVGRLAGGVAHDFNNLLTVISGYAEMLIRNYNEEDKSWRYINAIREAGKAATALTQQLLTVSRRNVVQPVITDLNEVFSEGIGILRGLVGEQVNLQIDFEPKLPPVLASPSQMEQILMNLVINAKDAIDDRGTIKVKTFSIHSTNPISFADLSLTPGHYVALSVEDNGTGMTERVKEHLFEPFFTTKRGGTGLGLSTVYGIIKQHKGIIATESEIDKGTKFTVILPASEQELSLTKSSIKDSSKATGNEKILLVEDESGVRELVEELLKDKGYDVTTACNGGEALEILAKNAMNFNIIITDVIMPRVSGFQLVEKVLSREPNMKIIIMSGCTQDLSVPESLKVSPLPFIAKPFNTNEFLNKVRSVLDEKENSMPLLDAINR